MDERIKNKDCKNLMENLAYYIKSKGLKIEKREDLDKAFKGYLKQQKELDKIILAMPIDELKQNLGFNDCEVYCKGEVIFKGNIVFTENIFNALIGAEVKNRMYIDTLNHYKSTEYNMKYTKGDKVELYVNGELIKKGIVK